MRVAPHGRATRPRAEALGSRAAAQHDPQRREARRWPVHAIVEPCGGPAEGEVAGRAVADHAVGRVDRFVDEAARQARERDPERRRHDAVGEVLREAFDRRARDAGHVERGRVPTDDHRDGGARVREPPEGERVGDGPHMRVETSLRQTARGEQAEDHDGGQRREQRRDGDLDCRGCGASRHQEDCQGQDAVATARGRPAIVLVEASIEPPRSLRRSRSLDGRPIEKGRSDSL